MPYTPNPQHRSAQFAQVKSQWMIPVPAEVDCYNVASQNNWLAEACYWGLYLPPVQPPQMPQPTSLGVTPGATHDLFVAKFVVDQNNWHGYPVAHWLSPFDKPPSEVLLLWLDQGYISKPRMSKIRRGKKCAL